MGFKTSAKKREAGRKHYSKNSEAIKALSQVRRDIARLRNREYLRTHLESHPCVDCGETDIVVLEFDHVTGQKDRNVTTMAHSPVSIKTLQLEMDKCQVRCANCHRRKTTPDSSYRR